MYIFLKEKRMKGTFWSVLSIMVLVSVSGAQAGAKSNNRSTREGIVAVKDDESKRFSCAECPKVFARKASLKTHILRHRNIRNFSCEQCSARFVTKGGFDRHRATHLNFQQRVEQGIKTFSCSICLATFLERTKLERHMKVHTAPNAGRCKRHKCPHCPTYFVQLRRLNAHIEAHRAFEIEQEQEKKLLKGLLLEEFEPQELELKTE